MAVQKNKMTPSKRGMRRAHDGLNMASLVVRRDQSKHSLISAGLLDRLSAHNSKC